MNSFPHEEWDVVILGGGLSGLSAGIRCAQFFKKVLVLESHSVIGGLNSYYYVKDRRNIFSSGLHTVTNANAANRRWGAGLVFRNLGIKRDELSLYPPKYSSRISMPGNTLHFNNNPQVLENSIQSEFPSAVEDYSSLVAAIMTAPRPTTTMRPGFS